MLKDDLRIAKNKEQLLHPKNKQSTTENSYSKEFKRLPCRGCIETCKNYRLCDGKIWRMSI